MLTLRQRGWLLPPAAVALLAGVFIGRASSQLLFSVVGSIVAFAAVLLLKGRLRFVACIAFAFILGSLAGFLGFHPSLPDEGDYLVGGVISEEIYINVIGETSYEKQISNISDSQKRRQVRVCLSSVTLNDHAVSGKAYWTFYLNKQEELPVNLIPGKYVTFQATLYHPEGTVNPTSFNFKEYLLRKGITFGVYGNEDLKICDPLFFSYQGVVASIRHQLSEALQHSLNGISGRYASVLLLGIRYLVPTADRAAFEYLGIAHILSISGLHVGVLIGMLTLLFRLLNLRQKVRLIIYAIVLLFYSTLCDMSQPVIRASLLLLLTIEGRIINRPRSSIHFLSAVMIVMILFSPSQVTGPAFAMTFLAVFGIFWLLPWLERLKKKKLFSSKILFRIFGTLLVTFGAMIAVNLPDMYFYQRSHISPLYLIISPLAIAAFSLLVQLYWIALLLLPIPGLITLLSKPLSFLTEGLLSGVHFLESIPGLSFWIHSPNVLTVIGFMLFLASTCSLVRLSGKIRFSLLLTGIVVTVISLLPYPHTTTEYTQFSVGNADAAVLWDQNEVVVIDVGTEDGEVSDYLRNHRLTPNLVILTHLHSDHAGGLYALAKDKIPIHTICLPFGAELQEIDEGILDLLKQYRDNGTEIRYLSRGDVIPLPSGTLTVLWPEDERVRPRQDANRYSLSGRLILKGTSMLLTGDLHGSYEMYAAASSDILKAAHHGSVTSTLPEFLSAVSPDVILLSCKTDKRTEDFIERTGFPEVWSTSDCGAVTVRFEDDGYTVTPYLSPVVSGGTDHGS